MLFIDVRSDIDKVVKMLDGFESDQLPFATSKALNTTAFEAMAEVIEEMPTRFTLRRNWILKGVRVLQSSKTNLRTIIYDRDKFMAKQETGGIQVNLNGKKYLAVPMPDLKRTGGGNKDNADLLKNLGNFRTKSDPTGNIILIPARDGRIYLAVRDAKQTKGGRGGNTLAQTGLRFVWELRPSTEYKERFGFGETVGMVFEKRFATNFAKAIVEAMETRKPR